MCFPVQRMTKALESYSNHSNRFPTRTPAPRELDREEKGRCIWPNQSRLGQTWPSLELLRWVNRRPFRPNLRRTRASWLQLGASLSQLQPNMVQRGHFWTQIGLTIRNLALCGASGAEVGPKKRSTWATWPCTNPFQSQKTVRHSSGKNASFQNVALH